MSPNALRKIKVLVVGSFALALSACAGDLNPVRDVFVVTGIGDTPGERPDFVAETRPERLEYVPIGTKATERETPPKTAAEIAAMEAELRKLQSSNETSALEANTLALSPAPEPVSVEPIPELSDAPEPIPPERRN